MIKRVKELEGNLYKRGFKKDKISAQCEKAKAKDRDALLVQNKENKVNLDAVPLILDSAVHRSRRAGGPEPEFCPILLEPELEFVHLRQNSGSTYLCCKLLS